MYMSDAFCLASSYEGFPISLIEAMSVGLVPLCTPVGGIIDTISNDVNGLLAYDYSENAIYELLNKYFSCLQQMRNNIMQITKEYSIENCAINHLTLFNATNK